MSTYRHHLPQLDGSVFLLDGGIETTLESLEGFELPHFAAFHLMRDQKGEAALKTYYERYIAIAKSGPFGFILETPTWRANTDWGDKLGYSPADLANVNRKLVAMMEDLRASYQTKEMAMVVSGKVGPRGDGYKAGNMSPDEAKKYHSPQIRTFSDTVADMVTAMTMTNANEAIGITRAAQEVGIPVVISFTLEINGRLPSDQSLKDAIEAVDKSTGRGPAYYMINCAHPTHFAEMLTRAASWLGKLRGGAWLRRLRGIRANASKQSHEELNDADVLDSGNPTELALQYRALVRRHPQINVLGGCCGTDRRHIECICRALGGCKVRSARGGLLPVQLTPA